MWVAPKDLSKIKPEQAVTLFTEPLLKKHDVVIEVGARFGGSTTLFSRAVKQVYAFEPNPYSFKVLEKLLKFNNLSNVLIHNVAVGKKTAADGRLHLTGNSFTDGAALRPCLLKDVRYVRSVPTKIVALDDVKFTRRPTFMVLDCEASEENVLRGAQKVLTSIRTVVVETHRTFKNVHTATRCSNLLRAQGFIVESKTIPFYITWPKKKLIEEVWLIARR